MMMTKMTSTATMISLLGERSLDWLFKIPEPIARQITFLI
jgi:hypothetical protein